MYNLNQKGISPIIIILLLVLAIPFILLALSTKRDDRSRANSSMQQPEAVPAAAAPYTNLSTPTPSAGSRP